MKIHASEKPVSICRALRDAGFSAWLVGGAVRDSLIAREPNDWDIATSARPEQVLSLFSKVIETGLAHGTVTVVLDDERFEVTTYRADGSYSDGRRPDTVTFLNSIEADLSRRDFTVNAIAYDPIGDVLLDPFGGAVHIEARIIAAVGDPWARFNEDSLRMLRAVRFAAVLGFEISPSTMAAIVAENLQVAPERIHDEFIKGLLSNAPDRFLGLLRESSLLGAIAPELLSLVGCGQNKYHEFDVWTHTLKVVTATPADERLRIAAVFHDIAKPATKGTHPITGEVTFYGHENIGAEVTDVILRRLMFSNDTRESVVHLVRHHLIPDLPSAAALRRWVRKVGREKVEPLLALAKADAIGKGMPRVIGTTSAHLEKLSERIAALELREPIVTNSTQLAISGKDVMLALGIGPGPMIGQKLRELLELVTDDPGLNTRDALMGALTG